MAVRQVGPEDPEEHQSVRGLSRNEREASPPAAITRKLPSNAGASFPSRFSAVEESPPTEYRGWTVRWTGWWLNPLNLVLTSAWFAFKAYRNQYEAARGFLGRKERPKILVSPWPGPVQDLLEGDEYTTEMQPGQQNLAWLTGAVLEMEADGAKNVSRIRLLEAIDQREGLDRTGSTGREIGRASIQRIRTSGGSAFIERHHDHELYGEHARAMDRSGRWPDPQSADDGHGALSFDAVAQTMVREAKGNLLDEITRTFMFPMFVRAAGKPAVALPPGAAPHVCLTCGGAHHFTLCTKPNPHGDGPCHHCDEVGLSGPAPIAGVPEGPGVSDYLRGKAADRRREIGGAVGGQSVSSGSATWAKGEDRECAACHQRLRSAPWTDPETQKRYEADTSCYTCGGKDMVPRR